MRRNRAGGAQLRLDGIDTLETHYRPPHGPELHQPAPYAGLAAEALLDWLGFGEVGRDAHGIVKHERRPVRLNRPSEDLVFDEK
ncbi:hypothetical protein ABZZ47_02300 [Streptomyces sp. NPDC006465]|uniref:hypothetical protein n=1 Tax=Streptomyces sp. NPDC006465 TaxID=3157174 RepID=UPI0033ACAD4B